MANSKTYKRRKRGELIADRYRVTSLLGEGGAGIVYRCVDTADDDAQVAVKVLIDPRAAPRFRREAKLLRRTSSPYVIAQRGAGVDEDGRPYLVLDYCAGGSLRKMLDKRGKLEPSEAAWLLIQAVRGLRDAATVHRDLKPENLLLARTVSGKSGPLRSGDEEPLVRVADFGLAKAGEDKALTLTMSGQVMGTPAYMSPEQCRSSKRVGIKTDIYALGVLLYEMVSGRVPFNASNAYDTMAMHCNEEPALGRLPQAVKAICGRCLAKAPGKRYPSLSALERDLAALAGGERVLPAPAAAGGRWWLGLTLALVVILALAALAAYVWWGALLPPAPASA
ncbi:MAG: serine/threonine-protein kinase [Planctomycetota bacterium]